MKQYLQQRANIIQKIRRFFAERNVLEVATPLLMPAPVTDPYLETFSVDVLTGKGRQTRYLQTSPEYAMKRFLANGSGCIYQICKAFRDDECGRLHRPEFTMLEWYRVGFDDDQLMQEVSKLLSLVLSCGEANKISYQSVFQRHLQINPLLIDTKELKALCDRHCHLNEDLALTRDDYLQLLFAQVIEPQLGQEVPVLVYDFPASQAALARLKQDRDVVVAARFEAYYRGIELANGYWELTDVDLQRKRFEADLVRRAEIGAKPVPIDEGLLEAMASGLPDCAGVALGIDRLIMLATGADAITALV